MSVTTNDLFFELISAQSALNMKPDPIEGSPERFLSECDGWARHSMTHIKQATKLLGQRLESDRILSIICQAMEVSEADGREVSRANRTAERIIKYIKEG